LNFAADVAAAPTWTALWGPITVTVHETLTGVECTVTVIRIRAKLLSDGGPTMWAELMDGLREIHLGLKPKRRTGPSEGERLQAAYEKVMAKRAKG
jgi:hypothetical protein